MVTDSVSSSRKTTKGVLFVQTISQIFYIIGSIVLKGYSAVVQNAVSVARNVAAIKGSESKLINWALIISGVVLGIMFNNRGAMGWLPVIANLEYSLVVFSVKNNERALKIAFLIDVALYAVFNAVILNFVGTLSNIVVVVMTIIFLIKDRK